MHLTHMARTCLIQHVTDLKGQSAEADAVQIYLWIIVLSAHAPVAAGLKVYLPYVNWTNVSMCVCLYECVFCLCLTVQCT